jgi:hypothetical protein
LASCVEPFDPEIDSYEEILVVDGIVSDEDISAKVRLSRSYSYNEDRSNPESNAIVIVSDEEGNNFTLSETDDGYYTYDKPDLSPVPGKYYKLYIMTSGGSEYESDYQEMLQVPEIDSLYYIDHRGKPSASYINREGVDFFVSTSAEEDKSRYYKWEWEESWKILPPINYPTIKYCWQYNQSSGIHIATTENLSENKLENEFIYNVPFSQNKLSIEYTTNIKQYAVTRDNYIYLTKLQKINQGSGGFFDPIPAALSGNVSSITDPDEPVLGFFEASTVSSYRMYIDREELKYGYVATGFEDCEVIYIPDSVFNEGGIRDYYYIYQYYDSFLADTIVVMSNYRKCYDCSFVGDPKKPDYWRDEL